MIFTGRKSQVTFFIILGVLLLIIVASFFMIFLDDGTTETGSVDNTELGVFVTRCLEETSKEAITKAGINAGYIGIDNSPSDEYYSIDSPYLSIFDGQMKLPYWAYENDDGLQASEMPPLYKQFENDTSIESQLENYIENNLKGCLNDFSEFEKRNTIVNEKSKPNAKIDFTENNVLVDLNYELEVINNGTTSRPDLFKASIPVRVKKVYSLAKEITESEMNTAFLEDSLRDLINAHSAIDSDYLPPMYGGIQMTSCSNREFWVENNVKEDFREMLTGNIPYIQIAISKNSNYQVDSSQFESQDMAEVAQGVMNRLITRVSETNYPDISADFSYSDNFPLYLDFGEEGFLEPKGYEMNILIGNYCLYEYKFYYNTKVPVLITLYDEASDIDNKGYLFQFPIMVVLKDNFPKVKVGQRPSEPEFKTYECSRKNLLSEINISVKDNFGKPIKDAYVTSQCGPSFLYERDENGTVINATRFANKCFIGTTDETGKMIEGISPCFGSGIVEVKAPGYLSQMKLTGKIEEGKSYNYSFTLSKVVKKDVVVDKYYVKQPVPNGLTTTDNNPAIITEDGNITQCRMHQEANPIQSNERVIIRLEKIDSENGVLEIKPFAMYSTQENATLSLAPGNYSANLILFRDERYPGEMTIKKNSQIRKIDGGPLGSDDKFYYPEGDVELQSIASGGALYEFEITSQDLYNSEKIRFHVIDEGKPKFIENVGRALSDREDCSRLNYNKIKPEFQR